MRPALALNPLGVEILGLRLGMAAPEVISRLTNQGARDIIPGPAGASGIPASVKARTGDGNLLVEFAPAGEARRITYTLNAHGANETELIRASVVDRFGDPATSTPLTWCRAPDSNGVCPPGLPVLTFKPGQDVTRILTLWNGKGP
jgi:hypothetical protein